MSTSGLGAQLSVGKESTWGTPVARNRWFEFRQEGLQLDKEFLRSRQLKAGAMFQTSTRRVATTKGVSGQVTMEVPNKSFGIFLDQLHGNVVTPVQQGATAAYLQTHNIGTTDPAAKSLTVQVGKPDVGGTTRAFTYPGAKVQAITFAAQVGEFLTAQIDLDAKDEDTATALDTPAYPASLRSFDFTQGVVLLNGASAGVVKGFSLPLKFEYANDRFSLGSTVKSAPLVNGYPDISPTLDIEFKDLATAYNLFTAGTIVSLVLTFTGPLIASTFYETIKFTMSAVGLNGESPTVEGPDLLMQNITCEVLDDGTNPPLKIEYTSTDTTI